MRMLVCLLAVFLTSPVVAETWLPLAVGNSWTYNHRYSDREADYSQWPNYVDSRPRVFTISVLRTEVIKDETYYVLSDMPDGWPPVPDQFIAGKKLRWSGSKLMERTDKGEQALFRFSASGSRDEYGHRSDEYATSLRDGRSAMVRSREFVANEIFDFIFLAGGENAVPSWALRWLYDNKRALRGSGPGVRSGEVSRGPTIVFLNHFGISTCSINVYDDDAPLFKNSITGKSAVIGTTEITIEEARSRDFTTSAASNSWGQMKRSSR